MTVGICDDERKIRKYISDMVGIYDAKLDVVMFESGEELLKYGGRLDILFMDIQMPDVNGMDVARELRKQDEELLIIFISALEEYVFKAFDVGAFNYLVKPIDKVKFYEVLGKACALVEAKEKSSGGKADGDRVMLIHSHGVHINVRIDDIIYAEVLNRKVTIYMTDGNSYEYYGKLADLSALAGEAFFRVHRAYLVNMRYVKSYNADTIYMTKGCVQVSKAKYKDFVQAFLRFTIKE